MGQAMAYVGSGVGHGVSHGDQAMAYGWLMNLKKIIKKLIKIEINK